MIQTDMKNKKCKECGKKLTGEMIFYPKLCLSCVIKKESA